MLSFWWWDSNGPKILNIVVDTILQYTRVYYTPRNMSNFWWPTKSHCPARDSSLPPFPRHTAVHFIRLYPTLIPCTFRVSASVPSLGPSKSCRETESKVGLFSLFFFITLLLVITFKTDLNYISNPQAPTLPVRKPSRGSPKVCCMSLPPKKKLNSGCFEFRTFWFAWCKGFT